MPTINRPTSRQIRFMNTLTAERNSADIGPALLQRVADVASERASSAEASHVIEALLAIPRAGRRSSLPQDGELLLTPSVAHRAGRMLLAGGIEATASLPNGEHLTIRVSTRRRSGRGWANCGPTDDGARTNIKILGRTVGWVNVDPQGNWKVTFRTRQDHVRNAICALFNYAAGGHNVMPVREATRCGRCMRTLTDPVSIERGIGPECFGRTTGSQHAAVEREAAQALELAADALTTPAPRREEGDCGGCQNDEHCGYCPCCASAVEDRMHRQVAEREAAQERAAYENEMREERARGIGVSPVRQLGGGARLALDVQRARDLIAEALDAYAAATDAQFALRVFDRLTR